MIIIVYLVGKWETFHRRPMLEALADNLKDKANIICVNLAVSLKESLFSRPFNPISAILSKEKDNLFVLTPRFIFGGKGWEKKECFLIRDQVKRALKFLGLKGKFISWVYRPEQLKLVDLIGEDYKVYECYDEYTLSHIDGKLWPGIQGREEALMAKADLIFTTSYSLFESRRKKHSNVHYAPNGVDFALFNGANSNKPDLPCDLEKVSSPRIGYIGNFSGRIDIELLEKIAGDNTQWAVVLIGSFTSFVKDRLAALAREENVYYLGYKPYQELPRYMRSFDACILPFKNHGWNENSNPLKLWQYLAAGKPVVSSRIKEIEQYKDLIHIAENSDEFSGLIKLVVSGDNSEKIAKGIRLAKKYSWENLTKKMAETLVERVYS